MLISKQEVINIFVKIRRHIFNVKRMNWPVCGISFEIFGLFEGIGPVCGTDPVCESYIRNIHYGCLLLVLVIVMLLYNLYNDLKKKYHNIFIFQVLLH